MDGTTDGENGGTELTVCAARLLASVLVRLLAPALVMIVLMLGSDAVLAQKTDVITTRNGDELTGEMKYLDRGLLELSTDAMSTIKVKWPRVVRVDTDKIFQVVLDDGTIHFGSLAAGTADSVVIRTADAAIVTSTQSVVRLYRIKPTFLERLDGSIDFGIAFTQQNAKTEFSFGANVMYPRQSYLTNVSFDATYGRQDGIDDVVRLDGSLKHVRQYKDRWLYLGFVSASRNSQLSLEYRATFGGGFGRVLFETNKMDFIVWGAPAYSLERFAGQSSSGSFPLVLAVEFLYFLWDPVTTKISNQLGVLPILDQNGRWRLDYTLSLTRELFKDFDIDVSLTELFDSRPAAGANRNDLGITTSFGWSF